MLRSWLDENGMALDADAFLGRPDACVVLIPRVLQPNEERVGGALRVRRPVHRRDPHRRAGRRRRATTARSSMSRWARPTPTSRTSTTGSCDELGLGLPARSGHRQGRPGALPGRRSPRAPSRSSTCSRTPTSSSPTPAWAARASRCGSASRPWRCRRRSTSSPTPPSSRRSARASSSVSAACARRSPRRWRVRRGRGSCARRCARTAARRGRRRGRTVQPSADLR